MGMIAKFVSSKFSGYALIALILVAGGAAYWFWTELKEFGSLEAQSQFQAETIAQQSGMLTIIRAESEKRQIVLTEQTDTVKKLKQNARLQYLAVKEANRNADKVTRDCMALHLAEQLQFGPSREDAGDTDKARSDLDG